MCDSVMKRDSILPIQWSYDYGVVFKAWREFGKRPEMENIINIVKKNMDILRGFQRIYRSLPAT